MTGEYEANEVPGQEVSSVASKVLLFGADSPIVLIFLLSLNDSSQVDMMVTDTKGQHFVNREKTDKGKFAFTTDNYDVFEICFISRVPANMRGGR